MQKTAIKVCSLFQYETQQLISDVPIFLMEAFLIKKMYKKALNQTFSFFLLEAYFGFTPFFPSLIASSKTNTAINRTGKAGKPVITGDWNC